MNVLYSVFYWLLSVFSALLWHDCLSVMHYDIMPYFTSRATGQTGGKMKCKCNAMQVVVLVVMVVTFYFMDFAMCRVLQLFKVCLFNDIVSNWYLALVVGEHRGRDLWLNDFNRVKTEVFGEKPVPLLLWPAPIPQTLALVRTQAYAVRGCQDWHIQNWITMMW